MKMSKESYNEIVEMMHEKRQVLRQHMTYIQKNERYHSLEGRTGWDAVHSFMPKGFVERLYSVEGLNDTHITTAIIRAIKDANITVQENI